MLFIQALLDHQTPSKNQIKLLQEYNFERRIENSALLPAGDPITVDITTKPQASPSK